MIRVTTDVFKSPDQAIEHVQSLGVVIDEKFGVVPLDLQKKHVLLRGEITMEVADLLESVSGIELFPDLSIGPLENSGGSENEKDSTSSTA